LIDKKAICTDAKMFGNRVARKKADMIGEGPKRALEACRGRRRNLEGANYGGVGRRESSSG